MDVTTGVLEECYTKNAEALVRFAASQVGWADADDVVATAVLGVLRRPDGEVSDMKSYLYRSVTNAAAKQWRSTNRRHDREDRAFTAPISGWGDAQVTDREVALIAGLAALSMQQRAVIHLTYWEDLTPATIAGRLGVSEGTVRQQLARARAHLRSEISGA